jgi:hypothetical protein
MALQVALFDLNISCQRSLIRRTKAVRKMLGDRAYDIAELRQWLSERGSKPVVPNKSNRKQPITIALRLYASDV